MPVGKNVDGLEILLLFGHATQHAGFLALVTRDGPCALCCHGSAVSKPLDFQEVPEALPEQVNGTTEV